MKKMPVLAVVAWHLASRPSDPVNGHVICRRRWYYPVALAASAWLWAIMAKGQGMIRRRRSGCRDKTRWQGISRFRVLAGRADFWRQQHRVLTHYAQGQAAAGAGQRLQHSPSIFLARRDDAHFSRSDGHAWQTDRRCFPGHQDAEL